NVLQESTATELVRFRSSGEYGLVASKPIPRGTILGEYFGTLEYMPKKNVGNDGFRLDFKTRSKHGKRLQINGGMRRGLVAWANHSCDAVAGLFQVGYGRLSTVVAITLREIQTGQEVTVSYGKKLWFVCRCGFEHCCH
ncbi:hypothetical protein PHYSODRAFT_453907, partial [Phytophthora sojae]